MECVALKIIQLVHAEILIHNNFVEWALAGEDSLNQSLIATRFFNFFFKFGDDIQPVLIMIIRHEMFDQM